MGDGTISVILNGTPLPRAIDLAEHVRREWAKDVGARRLLLSFGGPVEVRWLMEFARGLGSIERFAILAKHPAEGELFAASRLLVRIEDGA